MSAADQGDIVDLLVDFAQFLNTSEGGAVEPGYDDREDLAQSARHFLEHCVIDEPHIIELGASGWSIEHPLRCRETSLLDCPVTRAAQLSVIETGVRGRWVVEVKADAPDKIVFLERVDA